MSAINLIICSCRLEANKAEDCQKICRVCISPRPGTRHQLANAGTPTWQDLRGNRNDIIQPHPPQCQCDDTTPIADAASRSGYGSFASRPPSSGAHPRPRSRRSYSCTASTCSYASEHLTVLETTRTTPSPNLVPHERVHLAMDRGSRPWPGLGIS